MMNTAWTWDGVLSRWPQARNSQASRNSPAMKWTFVVCRRNIAGRPPVRGHSRNWERKPFVAHSVDSPYAARH